MLIPSYLKNTAKEVSINDFLNVEIVTTSNEETFDILYCGTLEEIEGDQLITREDSEIPLKIIAKSTLSGKKFCFMMAHIMAMIVCFVMSLKKRLHKIEN